MSRDPVSRPLTALGFQQADGTGDWRVLGGGASTWYAAPDTSGGAALARRVLSLTGGFGGMADLDVRATGVRARLSVTPRTAASGPSTLRRPGPSPPPRPSSGSAPIRWPCRTSS